MAPKKNSRKRCSNTAKNNLSQILRRTSVWLVTAGVVAFQASSCGFLSTPAQGPEPVVASKKPGTLVETKFAGCRHFFAGGVAPAVPNTPLLRELCYDAFAVLHSGHTRTPVFVAQRLNRELVQDADEKRTDKFFADARLPRAERAELSDYKGSGYSRGHMAPAGDMPTPTAMAQSFSLANMVPQNSKQNSGSWAKIEKDTRQYALRAKGDVFVITGPVFAPGAQTIGANQVAVQTHLFKLVYDANTGKAWAHWQENAESARAGKPIDYRELENG